MWYWLVRQNEPTLRFSNPPLGSFLYFIPSTLSTYVLHVNQSLIMRMNKIIK